MISTRDDWYQGWPHVRRGEDKNSIHPVTQFHPHPLRHVLEPINITQKYYEFLEFIIEQLFQRWLQNMYLISDDTNLMQFEMQLANANFVKHRIFFLKINILLKLMFVSYLSIIPIYLKLHIMQFRINYTFWTSWRFVIIKLNEICGI